MATIGEIQVKLSILDNKFKNGLKDSERRTKLFSQRVKKEFSSIKNIASKTFKGLGKALALATVGFGGLVHSINNTAREMDKLAKISLRLNIPIQKLEELQFMAELSGVSFESLTIGMQRLARRIGTAATEGGELEKALNGLGLASKDLVSLRPDQLLFRLGDALEKAGTSNEQLARGFKFLDTEGIALLQLFRQNVSKLRKEFQELGIALDPSDYKLAEKYNDSLTKISFLFKGFKRRLVSELTPALIDLARKFSDLFRSGRIQELAKTFTRTIKSGFKFLQDSLPAIIKGLKVFANLMTTAAKAASQIASTASIWSKAFSDPASATAGFAGGITASLTGGTNFNETISQQQRRPMSKELMLAVLRQAEAAEEFRRMGEKVNKQFTMAGDKLFTAAREQLDSSRELKTASTSLSMLSKKQQGTQIGKIIQGQLSAEFGRIFSTGITRQAKSQRFDKIARQIASSAVGGRANTLDTESRFRRLAEIEQFQRSRGKNTGAMQLAIEELKKFVSGADQKKAVAEVTVHVESNENFEAQVKKWAAEGIEIKVANATSKLGK